MFEDFRRSSNTETGQEESCQSNLLNLQKGLVKAVNVLEQAVEQIRSLTATVASLRATNTGLQEQARRDKSSIRQLEAIVAKQAKTAPYFAILGDMPTPQEAAELAESVKKNHTPRNIALLTLGLKEDSFPSKEEVQAAFKVKTRQYHPDIGEVKSSTRMAAINSARDLLLKQL